MGRKSVAGFTVLPLFSETNKPLQIMIPNAVSLTAATPSWLSQSTLRIY